MARIFRWMPRLVVISFLLASAYAQIRESCLPYPSYARELKEYRDEVRARNESPQIKIEQLRLHTEGHISSSARMKIVESMKRVGYASDENWVNEFNERLLEAFRVNGYFKAKLTGSQTSFLSRSADVFRTRVTSTVEEGEQYTFDRITFENTKLKEDATLSVQALRSLFPMRDGEVFDTSKVRLGLDELRKAYIAKGYVNFTAVPDTLVNKISRTIALNIDLDQGKIYRVSSIEILADDVTQKAQFARLLDQTSLQKGMPFNFQEVEEFFKRNQAALPTGATLEETKIIRDDTAATVAITFNLRGC